MHFSHEPETPGKREATSNSALNWAYALDDTLLPEGQMAPVYPMGVNVLLARVGGIVYAVSGKCAHMACPLFMGRLEGYTIVCGCHDWRFDVRTGRFLDCAGDWSHCVPHKARGGQTVR